MHPSIHTYIHACMHTYIHTSKQLVHTQLTHIYFSTHNLLHTNPSPSLFSFLLSPCHLYLSSAACWKKLTCGAIRSFNLGLVFGLSWVSLRSILVLLRVYLEFVSGWLGSIRDYFRIQFAHTNYCECAYALCTWLFVHIYMRNIIYIIYYIIFLI